MMMCAYHIVRIYPYPYLHPYSVCFLLRSRPQRIRIRTRREVKRREKTPLRVTPLASEPQQAIAILGHQSTRVLDREIEIERYEVSLAQNPQIGESSREWNARELPHWGVLSPVDAVCADFQEEEGEG
jgi:hypothetical protein